MDNMNEPGISEISDQVSQQINDSIGGALETFIPISLGLTALIAILWIVSTIRKWMVEKAIFDMRRELREMNQRQKRPEAPKPEPIDKQ